MVASDKAYAFAKDRILDGRLSGGELISEGDVAQSIGVSRTPVREAFLRLEAEGLLRLYPKRGALVVPVSANEINWVMETRLLVERHAIDHATTIGPSLEAALNDVIVRQERHAKHKRTTDFVEADRQFHRVIVAATDNPILLQLHDSLRDRLRRIGLAAIAQDPQRLRTIIQEHHELTQAIIAGDQPQANETLTSHLQATWTLLRDGNHSTPS